MSLGCDSEMSLHRSLVLSKYKELLTYIKRLPATQQPQAIGEARATLQDRKLEVDQEKMLQYHKELVARVSFLRSITPRSVTEPVQGQLHYVYREGKLVEGYGESIGRVADGTISIAEAHALNNKHFKKFHGVDKPKKPMLF